MPHDLSHLGFLAGQIGRLITISTTPVIAGDSFEMDAVGALRLSPLRRGLAIDLMFLTLMRPSLVLFLVLWLKLVKDFLKVRCRLALLPFLISCLIWLDLVASLPLIKERILVIILLLHFLSL